MDPDYLAPNFTCACVSFTLGSSLLLAFVLALLVGNQALESFFCRESGMIKTGTFKTRNGTSSKSKNGTKVAEHSFCVHSCGCDSARAEGLQKNKKTNLPSISQ